MIFGGGNGFAPNSSLLLTTPAAQTVGAAFFNGNSIGVALAGDGMTDGLRVSVTAPGGTTATRVANHGRHLEVRGHLAAIF